MPTEFNVSLVKSRFFISKDNLESSIENVYVNFKKDLKSDYPDSFNPIEKPTPWSGAKSLLEKLGFETFSAEDGSLWIKDFPDTEMTWFKFAIIINTLVKLTKDEPSSFIYIEREKLGSQVRYFIEGGVLKSSEDEFNEGLDFIDSKVGKSPWFPLH